MRDMRKEINEALDRHFTTNKGQWRVEDVSGDFVYISGYDNRKLKAAWVALFILKEFGDVNFVVTPQNAFTRTTLRRAGYRI